jgi:hypothetical protein
MARGPKMAFPLYWAFKTSINPILTLKMVDSGLENKHFLNLHKKLA